jgi:uncharacterized protein YjiS (DUF1127 family)
MSYADSSRHRVPFAELVEPTRVVGETLYETARSATHTTARAFEAIARRVRARRSVKELSKLSDHVLQDIGVDRSEIASLARRVSENPDVDYRVMRSW